MARVLDSVSAVGAWSLYRLLRTAYASNCIRVRRSSDDTESDIGFVGGFLDIASMTSFVGANNAFVVTVYDQSGNGNDLSQSTNSQQPQIMSSGTVLRFANTPIVYCDFISNTWLERSDACGITGNGGYSWFAIFDIVGTTFGPTNYPLFCGFGSGTTAGQECNFAADSSTRYDNGNRIFTNQIDGLGYYSFIHPSSGQYNQTALYINGVSQSESSSANPTNTPNFADSFTTMGGYIDIGTAQAPQYSYASQWSEWILISSAVSAANRDAFFAEQHGVLHGQPVVGGMNFAQRKRIWSPSKRLVTPRGDIWRPRHGAGLVTVSRNGRVLEDLAAAAHRGRRPVGCHDSIDARWAGAQCAPAAFQPRGS